MLAVAVCAQTGCSDPTPATPPTPSPFRKVTLNPAPGEPIGLAVLPDLRVLHTTRSGTVWLYDPASGANTVAAEIPVYNHDEEGLQGLAIDPTFSETHWVYTYYSPPLDTPVDNPATVALNEGDAPLTADSPDVWIPFRGVMRLSRFKLTDSALDLGSEQVLLEVPTDRGSCCHVGGQIDFDPSGNLYLSTGDDTNAFFSDGYSPLDDRPERYPALDAQRTAANTNDLRGKLLRLRVAADGSVDVPPGNLFPAGQANTRPEIFAMGLRNPFRFSVDQTTSAVYLADYAPDATGADVARGPVALGHWMVIQQPGNYGWPQCRGSDHPYVDFDFSGLSVGEPFDCSAPVNTSPDNTGLQQLPPVVDPDVVYSYGPAALRELGSGGIGPMAGPAYRYQRDNSSAVKWPEQYSGLPLFYEWVRDFVAAFTLDEAGRVVSATRLPFPVDNPIDMEFGPDGALYVLEYGDGYFRANPEAQLARIEYVPPPSDP